VGRHFSYKLGNNTPDQWCYAKWFFSRSSDF